MKIMIVGVGRLGSTIAWMILREVQPNELILNDIIDLEGEILDLQHACNGLGIHTKITRELKPASYIIITAGYPRTKDSEDYREEENRKILYSVMEMIRPYLKDYTKIIVMTNPVVSMTEFVQEQLPAQFVFNPEEELMEIRKNEELGWKILQSKGYTNWGPAISVVNLIKHLEGIN